MVLQRSMYPSNHAAMPPPQARGVAPESFLLTETVQQSLPQESVVALQQVDNRKCVLCFVSPMLSRLCLNSTIMDGLGLPCDS